WTLSPACTAGWKMPTRGEAMASERGSTGATSRTSAVGCAMAATGGRLSLSRVEPWVMSSSAMSVPATRSSTWLNPRLVSPAKLTSASSSDSLNVGTVACVDADLVAGVDEQRHVDGQSRLELGWLVAAGGRIAFEARLCARDFEHDVERQVDTNWLVLVHQ